LLIQQYFPMGNNESWESTGATIGRTLADSTPSFDRGVNPGHDAPNVVIVLLDDTGFAQLGCFGSDIDTKHIDELAAGGVKFTNFHVTPLCSPTRAALLTGRSQHAVGMRGVSNWKTGFPHQLGHISQRAATIAEVLHSNGYATFCAGKWHLAPTSDISAAGPFDQWPLGRGFDRFYGFLEGETDQFHPELVRDNSQISPPRTPAEGYHLSEDLVDNLLEMVNNLKGVRPDRPFFAYLPFGATHAPHQAPPEYMQKYRGRYDEGWDVIRQRWFERQLELGVIPPHTQLAPRNWGVQAWNELPDNQRRLACRLQEAFAAFLDHTDDQIGRFIDGLRDLGELDNTIFVLLADNGASQEGGPFGVMHEMKFFNGILETPDEAIDRIDDIGGPHSHTNYPWGWAQCGNSPFRWYKQNTHEGGVHVPLIVSWPQQLAAQAGTERTQFVSVSDVTPTLLELLGIEPPSTHRGIEQLPMTGHSFANILWNSQAPAANTLQYFENSGSRALITERDGEWWKAVTKHNQGDDFDTEPWELYNLSTDPSECVNLAEAEPEIAQHLVDLWWEEAHRHGVLPLDDRMLELFAAVRHDRSAHRPNGEYRYRPPMAPIPAGASATTGGRWFDLSAVVTFEEGDEGVLWSTGTENSGVSVFVQQGRLVVDYNAFNDHTVIESTQAIPTGEVALQVRLERTGRTTGWCEVSINGEACGRADIPYYMRMVSSVGSSVGYDHGSSVSGRYDAPFAFSGHLHEVVVRIPERKSVAESTATAQAEMNRQ
jgi:arylsulfatase A-like enzyme